MPPWESRMMRRAMYLAATWLKQRRARSAVAGYPMVDVKRPHRLPGELVVSLTSYPPRFRELVLTLKSLLDQDTQADRTVLWVSERDFPLVPRAVRALQAHGLEIRCCEDTRSFKKIVPSLQAFPDAFIVTADDDMYYPPEWLGRLVNGYDASQPAVLGLRAHLSRCRADGSLAPYAQWELDTREVRDRSPGERLFPTGCSGVLYPPKSLHPEVCDASLFARLCPHADDVWLFWMAKLAGTTHRRVPGSFQHSPWSGTQGVGLFRKNIEQGLNDKQIRAMESYFGRIAGFG